MIELSSVDARRTALSLTFDGVDISESMQKYLLSMVYKDYEEGESDELQVVLQDRDGIWLQQWIDELIAASSQTETSTATETDWAVGQSVTVTGTPQYSSYGTGTPGAAVSNHTGTITYLNLKSGIPHPIHVDYLGWFAESEVTAGASDSSASSTTTKMKIDATITRKNWTGSSGDFSLPCGTFELDSIVVDGPPTTVTIKAVALPFSCTIRQTLKSKAWESISLSGIANEMASANGMTCIYESENDPTYSRLEQYYTSDIAFLQQLCEDAGISLKATNNALVLFDQVTYEGIDTVLTLAFGSGGYTKYRMSSDDADTEYASCRVSYVDPTTGTVIESTAYVEDYDNEAETNQQLEITAKVTSIAEAQSMAVAQLRRYNKYAKTSSITIPGNPSIVSGVTVYLTNWGAWNGKYIVYEVSHTVNGNGYVTKMSIRQVLEGY